MSADQLPLLGLLLGASVASGLRLYATVAVLGFLGRSGALTLPAGLQVLAHPWVILVATSLYLVEFLADKIPLVDSVWDVVHTFIRVPAAGLLAWAALADVPELWRVLAALCCGGVALSTHSAGGITAKDFEVATLIETQVTWKPGAGSALAGPKKPFVTG